MEEIHFIITTDKIFNRNQNTRAAIQNEKIFRRWIKNWLINEKRIDSNPEYTKLWLVENIQIILKFLGSIE